jgi:hypothetical protein
MPRGRASKRLQGQPPSTEPSIKRTRQPNKNTLSVFQQKQAPPRQVKRPKQLLVQV